MKLLTANLTEKALDWALAVALALESQIYCGRVETAQIDEDGDDVWKDFSHTDPALCLGLMEQYKIDVTWGTSGKAFVQMSGGAQDQWHGGKTLAEAVARCVVAMRLGDEVDVPSELCGVQS